MTKDGAALYHMVHRLPQKLNGGVMDDEHMVTIDNGKFRYSQQGTDASRIYREQA
jgi:hypothetical protein